MELNITDLTKSFGTKQVLNGIDFTFKKGRTYALLGRNGAGKTTLFNCISGELNTDRGSILLSDNGVNLPLDDVGFVFSNPVLPEFLTGYEFIKFFIDINSDKIKEPLTPSEYLDMVSIDIEDRKRMIKGYSHGMKNKLQLLCLLIKKPLVLLLDEPLTSFDVVVAHEIKEMLKEMKHDHIIILSTHILQIATDICDEMVILNHGKITSLAENEMTSEEFENRIISILDEKNGEANV